MLNRDFTPPAKEVAEQETARRLALLPRILELFGPHADAIFVGGSLASGAGYAVHPDSDIDTAIVLSVEGVSGLLATGLFEGGPLAQYAEGFRRGLAKQCTVETRLDGVRIECHLLERDTYLDGVRGRKEQLIRFRSTDATPSVNYGFAFDGSVFESDLPAKKIDDWFVGPFPFYQRHDGKFHPCRLLSNLLATPIIVKGGDVLGPVIEGLWLWMAEELLAAGGDEHRLKQLSIANAIPGNWKFSPETARQVEQRTREALRSVRTLNTPPTL